MSRKNLTALGATVQTRHLVISSPAPTHNVQEICIIPSSQYGKRKGFVTEKRTKLRKKRPQRQIRSGSNSPEAKGWDLAVTKEARH